MTVIKKNQLIAPFLGAKLSFIPGQDPMGMLNIGEQIFSMLLPGLNNVTERIRYYSFYCWFFGWYSKHNGSENPKVQRNYLRRAEYLLALISASKKESTANMNLKDRGSPSVKVFELRDKQNKKIMQIIEKWITQFLFEKRILK